MTRNVPGYVFVFCMLYTTRTSAADIQRFSEHAETTITITFGSQEVAARLWEGQTEVAGEPEAVVATAIYLPGSKLLWWSLAPKPPVFSIAKSVEELRQGDHCAAGRGEIVCFHAIRGYVIPHRSYEMANPGGTVIAGIPLVLPDVGPDIAAHIGRRIAQRSRPVIRREPTGEGLIPVFSIEGLNPLFAPPEGTLLTGNPTMRFHVIKAVANRDGWELSIQNSSTGRVGSVILDSEMRPVSGTMIQ